MQWLEEDRGRVMRKIELEKNTVEKNGTAEGRIICKHIIHYIVHSRPPLSAGHMFQDPQWTPETADT